MTQDSRGEIYALCCPDTGEVRYIGKAKDSEARLKSHLRDARRRKTPVYCWINKLMAAGKIPAMRVLEIADDWREAERRLIAQHRGPRLLNLAEGGDEPHCPSEVRAANGRKNAQAREADPVKRTIHRFLQRMGHVFKRAEKRGTPEKNEARRLTLAKAKAAAAANPQRFYESVVASGFVE
jgi:hypothetical protein